MAELLTRFLEDIRRSGDYRGFTADMIAADLRRKGALEEDDELKIRRANFLEKTEELIDILKEKSASNPNIVMLFREALKGRITQSHLAKVLGRPSIIEQHKTSVEYCRIGGEVTLCILAEGYGTLHYQWRNRDNILEGKKSSTLETFSAGEYFCTVTSNEGVSVCSDTVKVVLVQHLAGAEISSDKLEDYYLKNNLIVEAPQEIMERGVLAEEAYYEAVHHEGGLTIHRARLMVVGRDRAGKTSLVGALLGEFLSEEEEMEMKSSSTEGIAFTFVKCQMEEDGEWVFEKVADADFFQRESASLTALKIQEKNLKKKKAKLTKSNGDSVVSEADGGGHTVSTGVSETEEAESEGLSNFLRNEFSSGRSEVSPTLQKYIREELKKLEESGGKKPQYLFLRISDFAGQPVYLNSHIPFLSDHGVYLLVHDLTEDLDCARPAYKCEKQEENAVEQSEHKTNKDYMATWLNAISCTHPMPGELSLHGKLPSPSVLSVGTKCDKVFHQNETLSSVISTLVDKGKAIREHLKAECKAGYSCFAERMFLIDNTGTMTLAKRELLQLRRAIVEKAVGQPKTKMFLPSSWAQVELELLSLNSRHYILVEELKDHLQSKGITENEHDAKYSLNLERCLQYFHDVGIVVYFSESEQLSQIVIIDPDWLVRVFRSVVFAHAAFEGQQQLDSSKLQLMSKHGIISYANILENLRKENITDRQDIKVIMDLLQKYDFLAPYIVESSDWQSQLEAEYFIVPSMVMLSPDVDLFLRHPELSSTEGTITGAVQKKMLVEPIYFNCLNGLVPEGLYTRLLTRLAAKYPVCPEVYHNFARFHYDEIFDVVIANWNTLTAKTIGEKKQLRTLEKQKKTGFFPPKGDIFLTVVNASGVMSNAAQENVQKICQEVYSWVTFSLKEICEAGMKGLRFSVSCNGRNLSEKIFCSHHGINSCFDPLCINSLIKGKHESLPAGASSWIHEDSEMKRVDIPLYIGRVHDSSGHCLSSAKFSSHSSEDAMKEIASPYPSTVCEWRKAGLVLSEKKSSTFLIESMAASNSGLYTCRLGDSSNYTFSLPLMVKCPFKKKLQLAGDPRVEVCGMTERTEENNDGKNCRSYTVRYGGGVHLKCPTKSVEDSKPLKYQWCFQGLKIVGAVTQELHITLRNYNVGAYHCVLYLDDDHVEEKAGPVHLTVENKPVADETGKVQAANEKLELLGKKQCTNKIALLIANWKYEHYPDLLAPEADVRAIGNGLRKFNFHVLTYVNLSFYDLVCALENFYALALPGSYSVVFYAGHGFEWNGEQYMVPVDASSHTNVRTAISVQSVASALEMLSVKLNYIVFDSCRRRPEVPGCSTVVSLPSLEGVKLLKGLRYLLTTCRSLGTSHEVSSHSVFTQIFLKALPCDCILEIQNKLHEEMEQKGKKLEQEPEITENVGKVRPRDVCLSDDALVPYAQVVPEWTIKLISKRSGDSAGASAESPEDKLTGALAELKSLCTYVLDVAVSFPKQKESTAEQQITILSVDFEDISVPECLTWKAVKKEVGTTKAGNATIYGLQHLKKSDSLKLVVKVCYLVENKHRKECKECLLEGEVCGAELISKLYQSNSFHSPDKIG